MIVQFLSVEGETSRQLNTGTKSLGIAENESASRVNLGLDESGRVQISFAASLETDITGGSLGIVDGLRASFYITAYTVIVRSSKGAQIPESMNGDSIFWGAVAECSSISRDTTLSDVVGSLGTKKETITTDDGISSERWALEYVKESTGMETRLLVDSAQKAMFGTLIRVKRAADLELEALGNLVLDFNIGFEDVGRSPTLSYGETVLGIYILGLDVSRDVAVL